MRIFLPLLSLWACAAIGADKPAAVQLCVQLPAGVQLFSAAPAANTRSLGSDTWMLDFDVLLNGHAPARITRSAPECLRAWLPPERLKEISLDFSRLPLNLVAQRKALDLQLKADLWSDGGKLVIERAPWAKAVSTLQGQLVLERQGSAVRDWEQLPAGNYVFKYTPPALPRGTCSITLNVVASGTVRADRNGDLFAELVESYRSEILPSVITRHKLQCEPAEAAQVSVRLIDGAFRDPLDPPIERVRVPGKEPRYQVTVDGQALPFETGLALEIKPGQKLEFSQLESQSVR